MGPELEIGSLEDSGPQGEGVWRKSLCIDTEVHQQVVMGVGDVEIYLQRGAHDMGELLPPPWKCKRTLRAELDQGSEAIHARWTAAS